MKHTTDLIVCDPGDYWDFDGNSIVILGGNPVSRVAVVLGRDEEAIANAKLFGGAPKLLASIKAILPFIKDLEDAGPHGETWQSDELLRVVFDAREAVLKATGEQA